MSRANQKKKSLPVVALAGRRNAGKSSLLNAIVGRNRAITDNTAGLTRDILKVEVQTDQNHFWLVDTPGLDLEVNDLLEKEILSRADDFLSQVDLLLFLCEPPAPSAFDINFIHSLRRNKNNIPIVLVVNKLDSIEQEYEFLSEFYVEGMEPIGVSALNRRNLSHLLNQIGKLLPMKESSAFQIDQSDPKSNSTIISDLDQSDLKLAIIGKQNAGKSSLFNRLTGSEIALVSDVPGTTRDTLDTRIQYHGKTIRLIDTAGLKKRTRIKESADFYSMSRTRRAIQDSEVVIHLVDSLAGFSDYDKKISALLNRMARPCILAMNKWDAIENKDRKSVENYTKDLISKFPYARGMPIFYVSATTGKRIGALIEQAFVLKEKSEFRVTTAKLNELMHKWLKGKPGIPSGFKLFYATQADTKPPSFVLFVSQKKTIRKNVIQYLQNQISKNFSLEGIPVRVHIREKERP